MVGLGAIPLLLWLITNPTAHHDEGLNNWAQRVGEVCATTAMVLMTLTVILSTRARFLEPFFGGLDRMYGYHQRAALTALGLLAAHFAIIPKDDFFTPGSAMGIVAFLGLLVLIHLTLAPRLPLPLTRFGLLLPYHQWKFTHRFIGLFFLAGLLHSFNVEHLTQESFLLDAYARGLGAVGVGVYFYKVVVDGLVRRPRPHTVEAVRRLTPQVAEVTLRPTGAKLAHRAGQFLFVSFPDDPVLKEQHPFTISSGPREPHLRLSIKASGDFTQRLHSHLQAQTRAQVEGPYGQLDYKTGGPRQIWVAGGIGVTPFLSWVRDFAGADGIEIDFFYTVRAREEALFWEEFEAAARARPSFRAHLVCSNTDGRLTVDKMREKGADPAAAAAYLCGPLPLTLSLHKQLMAAGMPDARIHYEEFNFR